MLNHISSDRKRKRVTQVCAFGVWIWVQGVCIHVCVFVYACMCMHKHVCVVWSEVNLRYGSESGCSSYYWDRISHSVRISLTSLDWLATCTALRLRGFATTLIFFLVVSGDWTHILTFVQRILYRLSYLPPGIWIFLRIAPSDLDADPRKSP